jgi:hypothetical protein
MRHREIVVSTRLIIENENVMGETNFRLDTKVLKVDEELGLVLGWAIVCLEKGKPYFDLQGDHIPEDTMLKAAADFMMNSRVVSRMHKAVEERGSVVFCFPMTTEIAKAYGITTDKTGLMVAIRPDPALLKEFKEGKMTGFSIGGLRGEDEEVEDGEE